MSELNTNENLAFKEFILDAKTWVNFIFSKWKMILGVSIFTSICFFSYAMLKKTKYTAILTFAMEEDKVGGSSGGLSGALGLASSFGIDLGGGGGGAFAPTNLTELMKSRLIVEKVLLKPIIINKKNTTLAEYYTQIYDFGRKNKNINFSPNYNRNNFSRTQDSLLFEIHKKLIHKDNLSISQKDKKITILSIVVTSIDETFSKLFCENIAKETSDFYIQTKSKKARINVEVLQKQVDSVKKELNGAISGVASMVDNVYNLNPALNVKSAESKKRQIDVQANTVILTNLAVQLELAKITLRKETPLIQLIDVPLLPLNNTDSEKPLITIIGFILGLFATLIYLVAFKIYKQLI